MSDTGNPSTAIPPESVGSGAGSEPLESEQRYGFPWKRLIFAVLFSLIAWFAFWIALGLALIQFIYVAIERRPNEELKAVTRNIAQYLREVFGYITFARDEKPFPFAPFPSGAS
ncbi:MAG: DUF4389 domain-containing protein [Alphaproteobacteria bacterium]|nr:DUF4389 domain-containing protein [Alphaproteobacteria bacterium]